MFSNSRAQRVESNADAIRNLLDPSAQWLVPSMPAIEDALPSIQEINKLVLGKVCLLVCVMPCEAQQSILYSNTGSFLRWVVTAEHLSACSFRLMRILFCLGLKATSACKPEYKAFLLSWFIGL
eukprot:scaffold279252_cov22-Tisochrysis_lutea.AAC.2